MSFRLWCYDDAHNWGSMLAQAAQARGHDAYLFDDPRKPDHGFVFMHMHHHPSVRMLHKRCMAIMAMNPELELIPDYVSSLLYDDKLEQARQLSRWMPRTQVFYTPGAARRFLDKLPALPFVSKSSEGVSSHNARLLQTLDDARAEIRQAFSDLGIKCKYGQTQRGYLMWQDYVEGDVRDLRVVAIGYKRLLQRRRVVEGAPPQIEPVTGIDDETINEALRFANSFFATQQIKWGAVDLVRDASGRWFVLEFTVAWTMHSFYECSVIDVGSSIPALTQLKGDRVWEVLLDEIEAESFGFLPPVEALAS